MKKKIIFAVATSFFAVATVFNINMLQPTSAGDITLDVIVNNAQAQNSELNTYGDANWDHFATTLNLLDYWWTGNDYYLYSDDTPNNTLCDNIHSFCDYYDLSGDPVYSETAGRQIDDCDGQPNWC